MKSISFSSRGLNVVLGSRDVGTGFVIIVVYELIEHENVPFIVNHDRSEVVINAWDDAHVHLYAHARLNFRLLWLIPVQAVFG